MSSPLDRIEEWHRKMGHPAGMADDIVALVNVAKAAEEANAHAQDYWDWVTHYQPKLREALAALGKEPA